MIYKYEYANLLASRKLIEISKFDSPELPDHYKTMTFEDWCNYYFKLPKKLLKKFYEDKSNE